MKRTANGGPGKVLVLQLFDSVFYFGDIFLCQRFAEPDETVIVAALVLDERSLAFEKVPDGLLA